MLLLLPKRTRLFSRVSGLVSNTSSSRNNDASNFVEEEEEDVVMVVVVGSIDGPHEALGCVTYCFLVKFTDEKELVTDRWTDRRTHPHIEMRGRIKKMVMHRQTNLLINQRTLMRDCV